ncbi:MAG: HD domain-containing protein [Acidobacteria bacterium]|nr:HD domain-containing protein [Acidobacteriota bacterium]
MPIVQCHHERWNGSGYPAGLKGTQIPLEARLIAVIDSFHAIISERPYKKAMPVSYALDQLRNQAGTNFDPDLIETFCSIVDADGNIRVPNKESFQRSSQVQVSSSLTRGSIRFLKLQP